MELINVSTECGHSFDISQENVQLWKETLNALYDNEPGSYGPTFDCKVCGQLCILVMTPDGHYGRNFHRWMHERDDRWPVDGSNCYSVHGEL